MKRIDIVHTFVLTAEDGSTASFTPSQSTNVQTFQFTPTVSRLAMVSGVEEGLHAAIYGLEAETLFDILGRWVSGQTWPLEHYEITADGKVQPL